MVAAYSAMSMEYPLAEYEWREYLEKYLEGKMDAAMSEEDEASTYALFERALQDGLMPTVHAYYLT